MECKRRFPLVNVSNNLLPGLAFNQTINNNQNEKTPLNID